MMKLTGPDIARLIDASIVRPDVDVTSRQR